MGAADAVAVGVGLTLLVLTGGTLAVVLRIPGRAELALAALVLSAGVAIAVIELLSLGRWVTRGGLLAGAAGAACLAAAAWQVTGRPRPRLGPRPHVRREGRAPPLVAIVVTVAGLGAIAQLILALSVVPNEVDGLLYHLLRSALVVQQHTVVPSGPILPGDPVTMNPPNAELLVAWTMALAHTDRLAALVQWSCLPGLGLLVFAGARFLGFRTPHAAFAGAVAMLLPEVLLQATTAQNDLLLAVLVGSAALFAARGLRDRSLGDLAVAGVAGGLAVGTKTSALLAAPVVLLLLVAAARRFAPPRGLVVRGAALAAALVLGLGGFAYANDLTTTGDALGGMTASTSRDFTRAGPALDVARSAWSVFIEAPGFPDVHALDRALAPARNALFGHLRGSYYDVPAPLRTTVDEDTDGLGLVGLAVLLPLLAAALFRPREGAHRLVVIAGLGFAVSLTALLGYSPDNGRLVLPGLVLTLPLLAIAPTRRWSLVAVAALAIAGAVPAILLNPHRSPFTRPALLSKGRHEQQLLANYDAMAALVASLDRILPPTAPIGVLHAPEFTSSEHPAYAFFDGRLSRRVVLLSPKDLTVPRLRQLGLAGAVVWRPRCLPAPACTFSLTGEPRVALRGGGALVPAGYSTSALASAVQASRGTSSSPSG